VLGFYGGVQPTLKNLDAAGAPDDFENDNSISVEGFYKYQLTENISITPGVVYLTSGNQDEDNEDAIIGTLRTTFTF
jgi:carbohydrate-selective porin OprB